MPHVNLNSLAEDYLFQQLSDEINIALNDNAIGEETIRFLGTIASANRIGIVSRGAVVINGFYDNLSEDMDKRMTKFVTNAAAGLHTCIESHQVGGYDELKQIIQDSLNLLINSSIVHEDVRSRIDPTLIDDPIYLTFYLMHPVARNYFVRVKHKLGEANARTANPAD